MTYLEVRSLLEHPAAGLLRKDQAAFILSFLHWAFKQRGVGQVGEEDLRTALESWLEERRAADAFEWGRSAREYLEEWCSPRCGWLRRLLLTAGGTPVFEVTAATEKALDWLMTLRGQGFVGTESRMESIFADMGQLLKETSPDVQERIDMLLRERAVLDAEIQEIEQSGRVRVLEGWQVNERFARLLDEARTLLSDFRQVEENFRQLAQEVVERQAKPDSTRGEIVGRVLASHDVLRESPQGRSFYGFVRLLLNPERRERFEDQASRVQKLTLLDESLRSDTLLASLLPRLRKEQDKVSDSTQRLSSNLRRALETARLAERRRVRELVSEVQRLALSVREQPPQRDGFFEVDVMPRLWAGASRPLWERQTAATLSGDLSTGVQEADEATILAVQDMAHLSIETLRENVEDLLKLDAYVLLSGVLHRYPPEHGLLEVLGYFVLAAQDPGRHSISRKDLDIIELPDSSSWRLPRIMFGRESFTEVAYRPTTPQ